MSRSLRILAAGACMAACAAVAGGPLAFCTGSTTPLRYTTPSAGAPTVTLNYDGGGTLGSRSKAQADAIVNNAIAMWTNVSTATITLQRGTDMPVDVTSANYSTYLGNFSDGLSPVIYDSDGSIVDLLLGTGAKASVLGFAGSGGICGSSARFTEGRAVINGSIGVSDATMTNVLAHELGHLIGLDHSQLDNTQGLASSNYPLMYPIAYRTLQSLGDDDTSAVTALYPAASASASYGTLNGTFKLADGVTPVLGANIWVRETTTNKVYSSTSDYLMQNNGAFQMLLPPGTYTLRAEAIDRQFNGGSSVGQYSDNDPADATKTLSPSFAPPLYVAGVAMTPVVLGNGSPTTFTITAGCTATATFKLDGTGSVTGCGAVTPPANPPRLVNISTRGQALTGNDVMIGGFVIGGPSAKTVAVRAIGPSLAGSGITNALANPTLILMRVDGTILATNDNWGSDVNAGKLSAAGLAPSNPLESALYVTLPPGAYTAIVSGANGGTGVGLVEVYEVDHPEVPLINISTRGKVLTGNDVLIGGFIVSGSGSQTVVVRGIGPSLVNSGIAGALSNPTLQLVRLSDGATLATNDNWQSSPNAAQITAAGFAPSNPAESAIYATLPPGAYGAILSGVNGATGTGLIEVYTAN